MTYTEKNLIITIDQLAPDVATGTPSVEDLRAIDQYHIGGIEAVDRIITGLELSPAQRVLDVGSGFGGPARRVAQVAGCAVVGIDTAGPYVEAAEELTRRCGLDHLVAFRHVDLAEFDNDTPFDAAFTMHVQMSVADKRTWFSEIATRLAPHARLAVWEVCRVSEQQPTWPMPWSIDGSDSFLVTPDDLHTVICDAGFASLEWVDETSWVREWFTASFAENQPLPVLPQLIDDGITRMINFAGALSDGTVSVWRGLFAATSKDREPR